MKKPTESGTRADTIKTSLKLPRSLWRSAHVRALDEGLDLQDLICAAIEAYLKTPKRQGARL
jgi:hypothetical protein